MADNTAGETADETLPEESKAWTDDQWAAIAHQEGPLQIRACAGSGKTITVARRIAEMVTNGVDRSSIVAFTFTERAANQLKLSIRQMLEVRVPDDPAIGDMFIGTIHSFCLKLLGDYREEYRDYEVLSDARLAAYLYQKDKNRSNARIGLRNLPTDGDLFRRISVFANDIDTLRNEYIIPDQVDLAGLTPGQRRRMGALLDCFHNFERERREDRFVDYGGMVFDAVRMLDENPDILEEVRRCYRYFIVDEYQDVNTIQERLLRLLIDEGNNLCVVGDDDQAIYRWRGARVENFLTFQDRYRDAEIVEMETNFRSTQTVVGGASAVVSNNANRIPKEMAATQEGELGDVYRLVFEDQSQEINFVIRRIRELVGTVYEDPQGRSSRLSYGDVAILFRVHRSMQPFLTTLEHEDIPYTMRGSAEIFLRSEVDFVRWAFGFLGEIQVPLTSELNTLWVRVDEARLRDAVRRSRLLRPREEAIVNGLIEIRERLRRMEEEGPRRIFPQDIYQEILRLMGVAERQIEDPILYDLGAVSRLLQDFETVYPLVFPDERRDVAEFINRWVFLTHRGGRKDDPTLQDAVHILTIHSAKGLEFPVVFVPDMSNLRFPPRGRGRDTLISPTIFDIREYESDDEDERRLFYVALTRSRKYLAVTISRHAPGYMRGHGPSRFFHEFQGEEVIDEPIADPTPREPAGEALSREPLVYPTSYSDLRYYLKCPYDYKLRKIMDFSPPIRGEFGYGLQVHKILRLLHEEFEEDEVTILPSPTQARELAERSFFLRYIRGEPFEQLKAAAAGLIEDYVRDYREEFPLVYRSEVPFEIAIGNALVSGSIDLLLKLDPETRKVKSVDVIDFKTEKLPDSEWDPKIRDARFQVRLYAIGTRKAMGLDPNRGYIHHLSDRQRSEVDLSQDKLAQVRKTVEDTVAKIIQRRFPRTPETGKCNTCDYAKMCPQTPGYDWPGGA